MTGHSSLFVGNYGGFHSERDRRFFHPVSLEVKGICDFGDSALCKFGKSCQGKMEIDGDTPDIKDISESRTICYPPISPLLFAHRCLDLLLCSHDMCLSQSNNTDLSRPSHPSSGA